jgi:VanZ family protein
MPLSTHLAPEWRHRLFIVYVAAMVLVFLAPLPQGGLFESTYWDKVVHFGLFFGFALIFHFDRSASWWRTFLISTMFAAGVELVQGVLPFRDMEWGDLVAGAAGAALATVLLLYTERRWAR